MMDEDNFSMLDLFRLEVEQQIAVLSNGLMKLGQSPTENVLLEDMMRAAHSIKGAAKLVNVPSVVPIAHLMEDIFAAAQQGKLAFSSKNIAVLLQGTALMARIGALQEPENVWITQHQNEYESLLDTLREVLSASSFTQATAQEAPDHALAQKSIHVQEEANSITPTDPLMMALFRADVEQQSSVLTEGLLALEKDPSSTKYLESLMRAAHSIKGAAHLVGIPAAVKIAHLMEDSFVAAQEGRITFDAGHIDTLLKAVDMISRISALDEPVEGWVARHKPAYDILLVMLQVVLSGEMIREREDIQWSLLENPIARSTDPVGEAEHAPKDRVLRVSAEQLNRLMGLAGEAVVEANWLRPYAESMLRLKRRQVELVGLIDKLSEVFEHDSHGKNIHGKFREVQRKMADCREFLAERLADLESFDSRLNNLSWRLRREVVASRMRPFSDGVRGFSRMVRDVARSLGKNVHFEITGQAVMVDREILEKMEAPLNHLLRNAVDHGVESPEERALAGKPEISTLRLSAYHQAGMLSIVTEDDGRGINVERLRAKILERGLVTSEMAANLTDEELFEFLFLPGFTTRDVVTEISGRGVGLDVVHDTVQEMRGMVRVVSKFGKGTRFQMQLPLTLSVIPALLVDIAGEPYAFPLVRIQHIFRPVKSHIESVEGHQYASVNGQRIGLVSAAQILGLKSSVDPGEALAVVVLGERDNCYGLVVDRFIGERDLVVHVLPPKLGKVNNISAAALMEDGSPVLIIDVDDILLSIEITVKEGRVNRIDDDETVRRGGVKKRILVVDDSITVREVERKLLQNSGYQVDIAVDGMDGWNAMRNGNYNLVITDIDMPRMDGIEFVHMIKKDLKLKGIPVMIVSYKDRPEDRHRGLNAGANYYLTKGSFHDDTLLQAVRDLIGEAV